MLVVVEIVTTRVGSILCALVNYVKRPMRKVLTCGWIKRDANCCSQGGLNVKLFNEY